MALFATLALGSVRRNVRRYAVKQGAGSVAAKGLGYAAQAGAGVAVSKGAEKVIDNMSPDMDMSGFNQSATQLASQDLTTGEETEVELAGSEDRKRRKGASRGRVSREGGTSTMPQVSTAPSQRTVGTGLSI